MTQFSSIKALLVDLDGTVYNGDTLVDKHAINFFQKVNDQAIPCLFVTNRANHTAKEISAKLNGLGIPCKETSVLTSALATAMYLKSGRAYVVGDHGLREALVERGFELTDEKPDYVIVGFTRELNYEKIDTASRLIREGAQFYSTNNDILVAATASRKEAGNGVAVAAIECASATQANVIGKPNPIIFDMAIQQLHINHVARESICMIGDNPNTDIQGAIAAKLQAIHLCPNTPLDPLTTHSSVRIANNYHDIHSYVFNED